MAPPDRPIFIKTYNCVGAWNFQGNYTDSSGKENNGTLVGNGAIGAGYFGLGFVSGTTGYINVTDNATVQFTTGPFTMGGWIKGNTLPVANSALIGKWASNQGYMLVFGDVNTDDISIYTDTTVLTATSAYPSDNQWHHIMAGRSGTTGYIWVDGVLATSGAVDGAINDRSTPLEIGTYGNGGGEKINCVIDEVRLYNRLLTHAEVRNLMYGYEPAPISIDLRNIKGMRNFYWEGGNDNASMGQLY